MNKSILHFNEIGIRNIEKGLKSFMEHPEDLDSFADTVLSVLLSFGLDILKESIEDMDKIIRESPERKRKWNINRREKTQLLCRLGNLVYERTLFQNKKDGSYRYLLDDIMKLEGHKRMTPGAEAALLTEAIDSSYRKGGEQVSLTDFVSKQTVKNKLHGLTIQERLPEIAEKKQVGILYIDADEDHISEQILEEREDGKHQLVTGNGTIIGKIVYLYEGIEPENTQSKRNRLIGKHYFGGVYEGRENEKLWKEVAEYIEAVYDTKVLKKVYISGDGAGWIKAGKEYIRNSELVLDRFHLMKYVNQAVSHLKEGKEREKGRIYEAINGKHKKRLEEIFAVLKGTAESESKKRAIEDSERYILNNWKGITIRIKNPDIIGCSAEGHVSHMYSSRMSSRPMGWSKHGADQMCRLRCYKANGGDILELVKWQRTIRMEREESPKKENLGLFGTEFLKTKKNNDYYIEKCQASIAGLTAKKQLWFWSHNFKF